MNPFYSHHNHIASVSQHFNNGNTGNSSSHIQQQQQQLHQQQHQQQQQQQQIHQQQQIQQQYQQPQQQTHQQNNQQLHSTFSNTQSNTQSQSAVAAAAAFYARSNETFNVTSAKRHMQNANTNSLANAAVPAASTANLFSGIEDSLLARAEALADITKATQHMSKPDNLYLSANHHMYSMARLNPFESNSAEAAAAAAAAVVHHHHHHHPNSMSDANNNSFYNALYGAHHQNISSANSNLTPHQSEVTTTTTATTKSNSQIDIDPRDLEAFAEKFKQRRIKLGVTQADVGLQLTKLKLPGVGSLSQSTICRFESLTLSHNNMIALKPILQSWLEQAEVDNRLKRKNDEVMSTTSSIGTSSSISSLSYIGNSISNINNNNNNNINSNNYDRDHDHDRDRDRERDRERDRKRKRTSIAAPEKRSLETYFTIQPRPSGEKIAQIAEKLDLKKNVVRVWFCNQRQKQKRMKFASGSGKQQEGYNSS